MQVMIHCSAVQTHYLHTGCLLVGWTDERGCIWWLVYTYFRKLCACTALPTRGGHYSLKWGNFHYHFVRGHNIHIVPRTIFTGKYSELCGAVWSWEDLNIMGQKQAGFIRQGESLWWNEVWTGCPYSQLDWTGLDWTGLTFDGILGVLRELNYNIMEELSAFFATEASTTATNYSNAHMEHCNHANFQLQVAGSRKAFSRQMTSVPCLLINNS